MLQQTADLVGDIFQFDMATLQALCQLTGGRQYSGDVPQGLIRLSDMVYRTLLLTIQMTVSIIQCPFDVLRMRQQFTLLLQLLLFVSHQVCLLQLLILELHEVSLLTVLRYLVLQRLQLALRLVP